MATEGSYVYRYPRPMVTVDAVVFALREARLHVLLIERGHEPFKGMWALPGGFLEMEEELEAGAARELEEETGVAGVRLEQFHTFGALGRDPRGRVLTVAYVGFAVWHDHTPRGQDDAVNACWMPVGELPRLASDHNTIIETALAHVRVLLRSREGDLGLLPAGFSRDELRNAMEEGD